MKRMDLFCASPASTAICSSMDQRAMVRHGTRPINHRSHHLGDRRKGLTPVPCTSQLPIDPKPYYQRNRRSSAKQSDQLRRKKSSADINDLTSPPGSSRYLLGDSPFFELLSDSDRVKALVPSQNTRPRHLSSTDSRSLKLSSDSDRVKALVPSQNTRPRHVTFTDSQSLKPSSDLDHKLESRRPRLSSSDSPSLKPSSTRSRPHDQVVELRVSIHCKGCEGKIRKHISRMEGVTSFSIDLATKKVTVIGDVTPLGVLTSISRVKNAQFWPSPTSSSSSSSLPMVGLG